MGCVDSMGCMDCVPLPGWGGGKGVGHGLRGLI